MLTACGGGGGGSTGGSNSGNGGSNNGNNSSNVGGDTNGGNTGSGSDTTLALLTRMLPQRRRPGKIAAQENSLGVLEKYISSIRAHTRGLLLRLSRPAICVHMIVIQVLPLITSSASRD